jgi:hypothetical protein
MDVKSVLAPEKCQKKHEKRPTLCAQRISLERPLARPRGTCREGAFDQGRSAAQFPFGQMLAPQLTRRLSVEAVT